MTALSALKLKFLTKTATSSKLSQSQSWKQSLLLFQTSSRRSCSRTYSSRSSYSAAFGGRDKDGEKNSHNDDDEVIPTSGLCRPLSEILKELNKKVPDSLIRQRVEDGFSVRYVPWHLVNRIMNLHAPEWSGEVRNITYSPGNKSVSVVYRVTLYGTDAELHREATGTAALDDSGFGDPVQKAEAMAFRRACARFGLALHLYHEDSSE
ncbi:hypothetical protein K2173_007147 [Erythroxylum novogranatense]|uniref:DNA repair RAD52-like protein 1, mitochondrial n=1 Tax=Erythroxylum novogranatense TaxID=1862640 RepID=A0AAV8SZP8_9ROSI|nr:hypothetical protein K2173_007147 [Erythroxylum novogranatense]